jgi:hypothetical protein
MRPGVLVSALSQIGGVFDLRFAMPDGSTYTRTGAATGATAAGVIQSFAADASQRTDRGLAIEPARTNLALRSQEMATSPWITLNATVTADAVAAPDGTTTADKIVETTANGAHGIYQTCATTAGQPYTQSCFAKAAERTFLVMTEGNNVTSTAVFNLSTGVVSSVTGNGSPSAAIVALGDGWYWCSLTFTPIAATANLQIRASNAASSGGYTGTAGSGIYAWGAQFELGSYASSGIPTTAASVTRGLPVFTEPVPPGRTRARLTYADLTTTLVSELAPAGTFDVATAVINASKGRFGASELVSRTWLA